MLFQSLGTFALALATLVGTVAAQNGTSFLKFSSSPDGKGLLLAAPGKPPTIIIASGDEPGAKRAAGDLAADFERVLGTKATVSSASSVPESGPAIIIGTIGKSPLVDGLISSSKIDVSNVKGKWETYVAQVVSNGAGEPTALAIAGSDVRGSIFGIYDISEQIGVSPWYWWADMPPTKREYIYAPIEVRIHGPPSVKFRGIFLNDEAPALTGWAQKNFPQSQYGNPFTSQFYARVLELVLRLKGNYLWPAMWNGMFYLDDTKNGPMADEYGVFMGTSHHEPMARADKEQGRFCQGAWDWSRNKNNVQNFMRDGARRAKDWDTVFTLGMRGSGDAASATLTATSLEEVIKFQQSTLATEVGKPLSEIPQAWVLYKEVPGYWQKGMTVSDDVTLLWTDDNRGNIRRIPTAKENQRRGGSGMYYHFDYVGSPRNYKWINTIQNTKTWEQMHLAYERGVKNIWIVNVGDLKPMELPISHFMAMAYDMSQFSRPEDTNTWTVEWAARQWGQEVAVTTADIMSTYGMLCARRKYEDLSTQFGFSVTNYDEAELNYMEWEKLAERAQKVYDSLPKAKQDSYFQIVLHAVLAGKGVFEIYSKAAIGKEYANQHSYRADEMANEAKAAFQMDQQLSQRYHSVNGGKWNGMMTQTHIGYNNWQEPSSNSMPQLSTVGGAGRSGSKLLGIGIQQRGNQATDAATMTLSPMNPYMPPAEKRYIDVFLREKGSLAYKITSNMDYINVTNDAGALSTDGGSSRTRAVIMVDWNAVPAGESKAELTVTVTQPANAPATKITVPLNKAQLPSDFEGHVESLGSVSIEASHFNRIDKAGEVSYASIPSYGRTHSGVKLWPVTAATQSTSSGPALVYPFYAFSQAQSAKVTVYLSASENANWASPNKYAVVLDGGKATEVQPVPVSSDAGSEPQGWDNAVTRNAWIRDSNLGAIAPGKHELKLWLLEPTMVVTKIVIDLGGVKASELGPPESMMKRA